MRQIDKGGEFYEESRQTVSLMRDADEPRDVDFVNPDDVPPAVWSIQVLENTSDSSKRTGVANQATKVLGAYIQNEHGKCKRRSKNPSLKRPVSPVAPE